MPYATILFGVVLATLYGAAFHFWRGGSLRRLVLYIVLAQVGFWLGDSAGWLAGVDIGAIGLMNTGMATVGSVLVLFVGDFLSQIKVSSEE